MTPGLLQRWTGEGGLQSKAEIELTYCHCLTRAAVGHQRALAEGRSRASQLCSMAKLLKRVSEIEMEHCPNCDGEF